MNAPLRWAVIGAGEVAREFVSACLAQGHAVVGVASRSPQSAARLSSMAPGCRVLGSSEVFDAAGADMAYIATPHTTHARLSVEASAAGLGVLCEKPAGVRAGEVLAMIQSARTAERFWMEGFMYRFHPQTRLVLDILRSGDLGTIHTVEADFSYRLVPSSRPARITDPHLGGGAILDIGCYPVSYAHLVAGAGAAAPPTAEVERGRADVRGGVDWRATALLRFDNGIAARIGTGHDADRSPSIVVTGTRGQLVVPRPPWLGAMRGPGRSEVHLRTASGRRVLHAVSGTNVFQHELVHVAAHRHEAESPLMTHGESIEIAATLERWRARVDLRFPFEVATRQRRRSSDADSTNRCT
jgi:predicted dehydrogenase